MARIVLGFVAVGAWFVFAFTPRAPVSAGPASLDAYAAEIPTVAGSVVHESDQLALPTQLAVVGENLVVVDRYAERPVHLLSRKTGELLTSLGRAGDGPGEFRVARFVDPDPESSGAFWVYDPGLARLTHVDPSEWARVPAWERRMVTLESHAVTNPVWIDAGHLLAVGFFADGRLGRFDAGGRAGGFVGALPPATPGADVPPSVLQHAYQGLLKPHPDRRLVAIANRHASLLEIYTSEGDLVARTSGPFSFQPVFEVTAREHGPSMASGDDMRFGYVDLAPTRDRIYALFSGRTREGYPDRAIYGEAVHVFDWSGRYLGAFKLNSEVAAIAVDEVTNRLVAVRHLPTPAVVAYPLEEAGLL